MGLAVRLYGELTKVEPQEDGTIIVTGIASTGSVDDAGETVRPEAMKAALPDYMKFGAVREMHGLSAAGTALKATTDANGVTTIEAHVVDPIAVKKVETQVYKGFSIGGKVLERDASDRKIITKLKLNEISLVDRPCNAEAVINMWKADGAEPEGQSMTDVIAPYAPSNEDVKTRAAEMAKAAGKEGKGNDYIVKAREALIAEHVEPDPDAAKKALAAEVNTEVVAIIKAAHPDLTEEALAAAAKDVWTKYADGAEGSPRDLAKAWAPEAPTEAEPVVEVADPVAALTEALGKATAEPEPEPEPVSTELEDTAKGLTGIATALEANPLAKGLYTVSRLAELLQQLAYVQSSAAYEAESEGDKSQVPAALADGLKQLGTTLVAMAQEEVAELIADLGPEAMAIEVVSDEFAYAAKLVDLVKADTDLMEKAGARHSKSDMAKIQAMHDSAAALGATCASASKAAEADDLAKAAEAAQAENERLSKAIADAVPLIEELAKARTEDRATIADLTKRLETVEATPAAPKTAGSVHAVTKAQDANPDTAAAPVLTGDALQKMLADMDPQERAMVLTKAALQLPMSAA
jgi:hypothetical protein